MTDWIDYPYEFPWTFWFGCLDFFDMLDSGRDHLVLGSVMSLDFHLLSLTRGQFSFVSFTCVFVCVGGKGHGNLFLPLLYFNISPYLSFLAFLRRIKREYANSLSVFKPIKEGGLGTNGMISRIHQDIYLNCRIFISMADNKLILTYK